MNETNLKTLYQSILIEHAKAPLHCGKLPSHTHFAEGFNPLCGDAITVYIKVCDGLIEDAQFESASCSICTASASMMMARIRECPVSQLSPIFASFNRLLEPSESIDEEGLGEALVAFEGLREFPSRKNCARLPWTTVGKALNLKISGFKAENQPINSSKES